MSEKISAEDVKHVASLAKLSVSDEQLPYFTEQLGQIIGLFETLGEVNTDGVKPTVSVTDQLNVMRDDIADNWQERDELLANAPETMDGYIKVPTIIDESEDN
ncbi:Asp-tRNA(Asn)/Glu-tRNA(Gln) amidotransferase subunit GatC [Lentilactobacillus kribbianus]|uniref:Asp-tRNA(Asn)/Glu-tRNA(Gln) amidotransferase subunit GatC n=1 Tax=Lentilactobacillus kribbianus TaxID=2729622 RepID=UPI001556C199|nr:Asp-tRNA(Asn)/Glu-tRNA(Gln) amidotransferase subunit GatC [Lentilactobacillus kribbianus]